MKYLIISDIHGITTNIDHIMDKFTTEEFDKLIILGDLYYAGFNSLSQGNYDNKYILNILNDHASQIICVRGNCDADIDVNLSKFSMPDITHIDVEGLSIYLTHGHIYNIERNNLKEHEIMIYGHKHIPFIEKVGTKLFLNPGSISLPRDKYGATYMTYQNKRFIIYNMNDEVIKEISI